METAAAGEEEEAAEEEEGGTEDVGGRGNDVANEGSCAVGEYADGVSICATLLLLFCFSCVTMKVTGSSIAPPSPEEEERNPTRWRARKVAEAKEAPPVRKGIRQRLWAKLPAEEGGRSTERGGAEETEEEGTEGREEEAAAATTSEEDGCIVGERVGEAGDPGVGGIVSAMSSGKGYSDGS